MATNSRSRDHLCPIRNYNMYPTVWFIASLATHFSTSRRWLSSKDMLKVHLTCWCPSRQSRPVGMKLARTRPFYQAAVARNSRVVIYFPGRSLPETKRRMEPWARMHLIIDKEWSSYPITKSRDLPLQISSFRTKVQQSKRQAARNSNGKSILWCTTGTWTWVRHLVHPSSAVRRIS